MTKPHVSLNVGDVTRSAAFYERLFGAAPAMVKPDYARFDLADPPLLLALNQLPARTGGTLSHLGLLVDGTEAVTAAKSRLEAAGLTPREELNTTCCYAVQDKIWVTDPDGHEWEIFHGVDGDVEPDGTKSECCVISGCDA